MADQSDVAQAIANLIGAAIYPNGMSAPPIAFIGAKGKAGTCVRIFQGWPVQSQLDPDLAAGIPQVSIFPLRGKDTTRYLTHFHETEINVATLSLTASGENVTVGGTIPPVSNPHNLVIFANRIPYTYQVRPTDTLTSIAAALAALIPGATSSGAVVQLGTGTPLGAARVGISGVASNIAQSENRRFQVTVWANSPDTRTILAKAIRVAFAPISRIDLADGSQGNITFVDDFPTDTYQKTALYRRDIWYSVDYSIFEALPATQIIEIQTTLQRGDTDPRQTVSTTYA